MKIHIKEKTQENFIQSKNYTHMNKKIIKSNNIELNNNNEIKKISLPTRKNCFGSPKRKKLIISKTDSFQSNTNNNFINNKDENIFFSFGKIKPENKIRNNNINSEQNKLSPKFNKNNVLTDKNFINNENISLNTNESSTKKRKKYIIPKPNIKKNCFNYGNNLNMEKIDTLVKNDEKNFIKYNNKTLNETFYSCNKGKEEKDLKVIEEFMGNFKNKDRSESLKNALNMYKRYKSLSNLNSDNKLNNSCCELNSLENKLTMQKSEENLLAKRKLIKRINENKIIKNIKNNINSINNKNIYNNKNNFNSNQNINTNNNEKNKIKKFFLRKIIREEKCYRDKNGNIHVVDFKQSLINDEDKPIFNKNKKLIKKDLSHECFQVKKIQNNNQINNINNNKNRNTEFDKNSNKLRIINISKRQNNKKYQKNTKNFIKPQKIKIIKYTNKSNNFSNNIVNNNKIKKLPLDKFDYININPIQRNHSYQNIYNIHEDKYNINQKYNEYNSNYNKFYNNNIIYKYAHNTNYDLSRNKNYKYKIYTNKYNYNNIYNEYNGNYYKKESYPESDRTILLNRNNSNCSFYESKSISKDKPKILRHNNSYIVFKSNGNNYIDYIKNANYNTNNPNYYNENINFNNNIVYDNMRFNNDFNNNKYINYYESVRMPIYRNYN